MARSRAYKNSLKDFLRDPADAADYLNAALGEGDAAAFLLALRDVADVQGGIGKLASSSQLNRESMYRMLSEKGNPRIDSLNAVLQALGLRLSVIPEDSNSATAA
jgi:probable addiction module antidote protein